MRRINQCNCKRMTFDQWLTLVRKNQWTLEQAAQETQCGQGCGTCKKYLQVVYATGETDLPMLLPEEYDEIIKDEGKG
jgi:bacterioferritin-associated ferredoxin